MASPSENFRSSAESTKFLSMRPTSKLHPFGPIRCFQIPSSRLSASPGTTRRRTASGCVNGRGKDFASRARRNGSAPRGGREGALYPWGDEPPWERPYLGYHSKTGGPARVG